MMTKVLLKMDKYRTFCSGIWGLLLILLVDKGVNLWSGLLLIPIILLLFKGRFALAMLFGFVVFGVVLSLNSIYLQPKADLTRFYGSVIEVEGYIASYPQKLINKQRLVMAVERFSYNGKIYSDSHTSVLLDADKYIQFSFGDKIKTKLTLERPKNSGEFDYKSYLKRIGISAIAKPEGQVSLISKNRTVFNTVRIYIEDYLNRALPYDHALLATGMLIGLRADFSPELDEQLRATGTSHIVAVSGYNVNFLFNLVLSLAGLVPRKPLQFLSVAILFMFLCIVGLDNIPALRAGLMGTVMIVAKLSGRKSNALNGLGLSIVLPILINPHQIYSMSFQLSVAATLGIILLNNSLLRGLKWIPLGIGENLATSLAATLATLPVTLLNFGVFTPYAVILNTIIAPLLPLIMQAGIMSILLGWLDLLAIKLILTLLLDGLVEVIGMFANIPGAIVELDSGSQIIFLFITSVITTIYLLLQKLNAK